MITHAPEARAHAAFIKAFGEPPLHLFQAPGRVNLLGEHTDYNEGFVLPCAIDRRTVVASGPGGTSIEIVSADLSRTDRFAPISPVDRAPEDWANYARGVASELLAAGILLAPVRLAIAGNVPIGAGLSSSASFEVAVAMAFLGAANVLTADQIALLCQRAENGFVGCACGIMDHLVATAGREGHALMIDCRTLERRAVPLPEDTTLIIIDSGIRHTHASGDYNLRRAQCDAAARHYGVRALRDLDDARLIAERGALDDISFRRARHVVTENGRVLRAAKALADGDLATMGALMAESHRSMRDDFEITLPAIDLIVGLADEVIAGKGGARMTGGGFGGCVITLARASSAAALKAHILANYLCPDGTRPRIFECESSNGAFVGAS